MKSGLNEIRLFFISCNAIYVDFFRFFFFFRFVFISFEKLGACDIFKSPYYMENRFSDSTITAVPTSTVDSSNLMSNESNNTHSMSIHSTNDTIGQHNHSNNNNNNHLNNNHMNNSSSIKSENQPSPNNGVGDDQDSANRYYTLFRFIMIDFFINFVFFCKQFGKFVQQTNQHK